MQLTVTIPDEMEPFVEELEFFISLMARKLHVNRHKGFGQRNTLSTLHRQLCDELNELRSALLQESQFNVMLEASDVANFAFLIHLRVATMDKEAYRKDQTTLASGTSSVQGGHTMGAVARTPGPGEGHMATRIAEFTERDS